MHVRRSILPAAALCVGLLVHVASVAAEAQDAPARGIEERLNRVGADLFSPAPDAQKSIQELQAILAVEPNLAEAHLLLGIAYRVQGSAEMLGETVAELRQALALKPSLLLARLTLARVYLDMARGARARDELETALEQAPGQPQLLSLLGEAERQLGNPARSIELNEQALAADAAFAQARYYLGLALMDLRQHARAIEQMKRAVDSGDNPAEAQYGLGSAYLAAGKADLALAALRESARLDPSRPDTYLQLARAYRARGLLAEAEKALALARPPGDPGIGVLYQNLESELLMEEGLLRVQQGRLEAAAAAFQKVLAADASHGPARRELAEVRKRLQERARKKSG